MPQQDKSLLGLTADIVSAYVSNNTIAEDQLPAFIKTIHHSLANLDGEMATSRSVKEPAVPIEDSIQDDYLICLEDGKKLKMLRRYLKKTFNMSPEEYRLRWGLGDDYPMVAPSYSVKRRALAKEIGLGKKD